MREANQRQLRMGCPVSCSAWFPRAQVNTRGNWDVMGFVATGSYDYEVPEQFLSHDLIAPVTAPCAEARFTPWV